VLKIECRAALGEIFFDGTGSTITGKTADNNEGSGIFLTVPGYGENAWIRNGSGR
jgi:hypothetical protein